MAVAPSAISCSICTALTLPFGQSRVLQRYDVLYYRCPHCGFVQTETPYWLGEAYSDAITSTDIGLLGRNLQLARLVPAVIQTFFNPDARFLDYGGGYGIFVRLMRDAGLDFFWYDAYCENLFAKPFAADMQTSSTYELVTAFEVFEHLIEPRMEMERLRQLSSNLFFTTQLLPEPPPMPGTWWYYGPEHGQHVSLYSTRSLQELAQQFGLNYYSNDHNLHLFAQKRLSQRLFKVIVRPKVAALIAFLRRRPSLVLRDFRLLAGYDLEAGR